MATQFTTVEEASFARGIDARSSENQIREGFVRDLVNGDIVEGRFKKRKGYAAFAGNLPLRVKAFRQPFVGKIYFSLDSSIDLSRVTKGPLLVYGRSSNTTSGSPFTSSSDSVRYYTTWTSNLRKVFAHDTTGTVTATAIEHSIPTTDMYVGVSQNLSTNQDFDDIITFDSESLLSSITVNSSTRNVTVNYTNGTPLNIPVFLYYIDRQPVAGDTYSATFTTGSTFTVLSTTHNLSTPNILYQLYRLEGTEWVLCKPDSFNVNPSNQTVTVNVSEAATVLNPYRLILSSVAAANTKQGNPQVVLSNIPSPYIFYTCYDSAGNEVLPDYARYDDDTNSCELHFDPASPGTVTVNYLLGSVRTNEIYVDDPLATSTAVADFSPQMTLYGISHADAYGNDKRINRRGWVNHIDSYRSPSTTHMVAGLGGNLYAALGTDEAPAVAAAAMPTYGPSLRKTTTAAVTVGPAFADTGTSPGRTRGVYQFSSGGSGWATVTGVVYNPSTALTSYTLSMSGWSKTPSSTPIGTNDYVTIKGMSSSRHNGVFKVSSVNESNVDQLTITVNNPMMNSDYDDLSGTKGLCGCFTDEIVAAGASPFLVGDRLLSSSWEEDTELTVTESATSGVIRFSGAYDYLSVSNSLAITGRRTSYSIPLSATASTLNIVPGDTIEYSQLDEPLQVVAVSNETITLDRTVTWEDNIATPPTFSVIKRWVPIEAPRPDAGDTLIPTTTVQYFTSNDYDNQPFLRSAMVQNNLYLTNGSDEVYKYDGQNTYRAGIIPWQPGLFLSVESSATVGGIPLAGMTGVTPTAFEAPAITIAKSDSTKFIVGNVYLYKDSNISQYLTLKENVESDASHHHLIFEETLNFTALGTTPTLTLAYAARYYFRLNIKDVNGVTTASAVTGAEDFVAQIAPAVGQYQYVNIRLVGLPVWDQYDFRNKNIEVEVYRTFWTPKSLGESPAFYRLPITKACTFTGADGYIDIVDVYSNDALTEPDVVVGTQSPSEIPAAWDEPPRAKYVTTAGNQLVLANITDWPTLAISYLSDSTTASPFIGQKLTFRKDSTTTSATTDMLNVATYELKNSGGLSISAINTATPGQFTITTAAAARTIVPGDWVYLYFTATGGHPLSVSGWWQVSATNGSTSHTIKVVGTITAPIIGTHPMSAMFATAAYDVPVNVGTDYNLGMFNGQVSAITAPIPRIIRRIGMAINATMRIVDTSLTAYSSFKPWIVARSESDTGGQLIVKQPRAEQTVPAVTVTIPNLTPTVSVYVNSSKVVDGQKTTAAVTKYPSRLAVSYNNYPEIFDNLWTVDEDASDSIIDVNSSDGQEITGVIPFFGESAFGAALKDSVLVVFKQNSIYLVNVAAKAEGKNPVQRLQTQGLGCTAPYSIAPTKNGIAFANESGIYVLRTDQSIEYLGRFMERRWQEKVDLGALSIAQGHHYGVGRQYKLSVPMVAESSSSYAENGEVYVYNHTGEADGEPGGWARYTNHPVTGWANLFQDAFLASANGSVMKVRNLGGVSDYRDGNSPIESILETRALGFGNTGIRKAVSNLVINYRSGANSENTKVYTAPDLFNVFDASTNFRVVTQGDKTGLSDKGGQAVVTVMHSLVRRRCVYMSVKITNSGIDDNVEVAGIAFIVGGLQSAGIKQAAET